MNKLINKQMYMSRKIIGGLLFSLFVLFPAQSFAAQSTIVFDATSSAATNALSNLTWVHSVSSLSNRLLVVGCWTNSPSQVTGITYNGVSMTLVEAQSPNWSTVNNVVLYYLLSPAVGTNNISVTQTGSSYLYCAGGTYANVMQQEPESVSTSRAKNVTSLTASLTTSSSGDWLIGFGAFDPNPSSISGVTGTVQRTSVATETGWMSFFDSGKGVATGTRSLSELRGNIGNIAMNVASFAPAPLPLPIALDATSSAATNAVTVLAWPHKISGEDNNLLIVGCWTNSPSEITDVSYNGSSLTLAGTQTLNWSTIYKSTLYYLLAPTVGTNNISVTQTGSSYLYCAASSYANVMQQAPEATTVASATGTKSLTTSLTTSTPGDWLMGFGSFDPDSITISAGAGTVQRTNFSDWMAFFDSGKGQSVGVNSLKVKRGNIGSISVNMAAFAPASQ